jgi:hypothetical protein
MKEGQEMEEKDETELKSIEGEEYCAVHTIGFLAFEPTLIRQAR